MGEEAARDPTVQEIVVALRETTLAGKRRGIGAIAERVPEGEHTTRPRWTPTEIPTGHVVSEHPVARRSVSGATDIAALRDGEMQRLLDENARLNQRVVELVKIIEEQAARERDVSDAARAATSDREAIAAEVRGAIEAQLKPVLLTVLEVLKHPPASASRRLSEPPAEAALGWQPAPLGPPAPPAGTTVIYRAMSASVNAASDRRADERHRSARSGAGETGYYPGWISDLIRTVGGEAGPSSGEPGEPRPSSSSHRGRRFVSLLLKRFVTR